MGRRRERLKDKTKSCLVKNKSTGFKTARVNGRLAPPFAPPFYFVTERSLLGVADCSLEFLLEISKQQEYRENPVNPACPVAQVDGAGV